MKLIRSLQIVLAILALSSPASADVLKDEADARHFTDQVMAKFSTGDIDGGFQSMKPYIPIPSAEIDVMTNQMKMQQSAIASRFGQSIEYEFVREDRLGQSVIRIIQLHRFERHVMRWNFLFL
jgi:hypothetical protein